jgi:sugar transferase (PEP-CTERM/EpsH1 system associated)
MKLMMVLSRFPQPIDKGDKLRAYHQIKQLAKQNDIYLFCITDTLINEQSRQHLLQYCKEVNVYNIGRPKQLLNLTGCMFSGKPFQSMFFYSAGIHTQIKAAAQRIKPDQLFFQLIRTAEYANDIDIAPKTLDYMDAFSKGYERMANISSGIFEMLYRDEAKRLARYEAEVFGKFNKHSIISEQDRNLMSHPKKNEITVIPNGVDTGYFTPGNKTGEYALLFHGNMNYMPNINCAVYIANSILPELQKRKRDVNLLVSGAAPHPKVQKLGDIKNITVTGWIDDVRTSYNRAKIFIAPVQIGTGIQNKILEAMAMGIPCVVSPLVAGALQLKHGENVLIGDSTAEYCNHIEALLDNPSLYNSIVENALTMVRQNFKWEDTSAALQQLLNK